MPTTARQNYSILLKRSGFLSSKLSPRYKLTVTTERLCQRQQCRTVLVSPATVRCPHNRNADNAVSYCAERVAWCHCRRSKAAMPPRTAEITENSWRRRPRLVRIYSSRKSRTSVRRRFSAMSIWFSKSCITANKDVWTNWKAGQ